MTKKRDNAFIAVGIDTRPQAVKNSLSYTLQRLGVDYINPYQPARVDPTAPIKADMVKADYVRLKSSCLKQVNNSSCPCRSSYKLASN
jgi:aryl-alcohol dehydrogenase-like predicted oxidoreductase